MAHWHSNELAKISQVSVRTLHHYDRIGLLKPSLRESNGYRLYCEADLLRLQQIIALKFFGFQLSQIKKLMASKMNMAEHFQVQAQLLQEKAKSLTDASKTLNELISRSHLDQSISWETIIQTIEVYRMTEQLENKWVAKALDNEELKEYIGFEQELKTRFTAADKQKMEQEWGNLVDEIGQNLHKDPASELGEKLSKKCMDWVNHMYGRKHARLRTAIWDKGFKGGHADSEYGMSPEIVTWLDKAIDASFRKRVYRILANQDLSQWNQLLEESYGDDQTQKDELCHAALKDDLVSQSSKNWLLKL